RPTAGDEQQAIYDALEAALAATLLLQLALPDAVAFRFGFGIGALVPIPSAAGEIPEGPAWWAAREAINTVHAMQRRAAPSARAWVVGGADQTEGMPMSVPLANAYLLARDQIVTAMSERTRRLTYGRCLDRSQQDLAQSEGISQSAVSQALAGAGASAIVEGFQSLTKRQAP
ncbi:MAG TPA: hypothetical protein DCR63_03175, partial [Microbacterium sp.]|nr:hypothetical protein [Microbacterium sp.]